MDRLVQDTTNMFIVGQQCFPRILIVGSDGESGIVFVELFNFIQIALAGDADHVTVLVDVKELKTKIVLERETLLELEDLLAVLGQCVEIVEVRHTLRLSLEYDLHLNAMQFGQNK